MLQLFLFLLLSCSLHAQEPLSSISLAQHNAGFFSNFFVIVGMIDSFEKKEVGSIEVNLETSGYYYDPLHGPNWWSYYFKPFNQIPSNTGKTKTLDWGDISTYFSRAYVHIPLDRCAMLVKKHIIVRPEFVKEADSFIASHTKNRPFVSVHYRGTDKFTGEASPITPEEACSAISNELIARGLLYEKIFVATDVDLFLESMKRRFGDRIFSFDEERSVGNQAVHTHRRSSGFTKGKMALLNCLVLSKGIFLIRTASNLSAAAPLFNPAIPSILLNHALHWGDRCS